jgi:hypothetical protein
MSQRDRHTPEGRAGQPAESSAPTGSDRPGRAGTGGPARSAPVGGEPSAVLWEEWFRRAAPAQQQHLLELAARQGIVYGHQLTPPANGAPGPGPTLLPALLNGQIEELPPVRADAIEPGDNALDACQREAVSRALATPDVCLIQGYPGTGKSRVIAEIVTQAARRGERVLLLAPAAAAIDRVLERLAPSEAICPVRVLGPEETLESLPPCIRCLTLAERGRAWTEQTVPAAQESLRQARQTHADRLKDESAWPRFEELVGRHDELSALLDEVRRRRSGVAAAVEAEKASGTAGTPFAVQLEASARACREVLERLDGQLAALRAESETTHGKQDQLAAELVEIQPLLEARQGHRWWTTTWWKAAVQGNLETRLQELGNRQAELQASRGRIDQEMADRQRERGEVEERFQTEQRELIRAEIARREADLDTEAARLANHQQVLTAEWQALCSSLAPGTARPEKFSRDAVSAARESWRQQVVRDEEQAACAAQWAEAVAGVGSALEQRLASCANVVAGTTGALAGDPLFAEGSSRTAGELSDTAAFDLLVLDEAHEVTESEFAGAARRARRWALVGEPTAEEPATPLSRAPGRPQASRSGESRAPGRPQAAPPGGRGQRLLSLRPGFFQRLWQHLHPDPRRLGAAWVQREGKLICCLRPLPHGGTDVSGTARIESEPVADRPDVELRILTGPRQPPQLAEVVFPAHVTIAEAKEYIYRELGELAVQARGAALRWIEDSAGVALEFGGPPELDTVTVSLESGVSEVVACTPRRGEQAGAGVPWHTCRLQFDRSVGWNREGAERWVEERLPLRDLGRTVLLNVPHRVEPALARFLSDLLFDGACVPPPGWPGGSRDPAVAGPLAPREAAAIEFVSVPPLEPEGRRRGTPSGEGWSGTTGGDYLHAERGSAATSVRAPRLRLTRGGAGLETDLADNRPIEHLPADLRAELPREGLVNYLEALAVVQTLEALVHDPAFRDMSARWPVLRGALCEPAGRGCEAVPVGQARPCTGACPAIGVIALYPAQAELISLLMRRSPTLAASPVSVEVGPPSAFRQRECLAVLVSLTRSHSHRAVPYGEGPQALALALTRAAGRLILFGDPGTLARRSQWEGPLDHLDESAAHHERGLAVQLVGYIQGHGPHPSVFRLRAGGGELPAAAPADLERGEV